MKFETFPLAAIGKGLPEVSESSELATTPGTDGEYPLLLQHYQGSLDEDPGHHAREPGGGVKYLKAVVGEVHEWWNVLLQNDPAADSDSEDDF